MFKFFWERTLVTAGKIAVRYQEELPNRQVFDILASSFRRACGTVSTDFVCVCVFFYTCVSLYMCLCLCMCIYICMYIYIYIYIYVCMYIYIYIYVYFVCVCVCLVYIWKWKSLSCVSLWAHGLHSPWNSPGQNTGVGSSQSRDRTQVSRIAGGFFTNWAILCKYTHTQIHIYTKAYIYQGLPLWLSWWRICLQCGRPGFDPWVRKIPWRKESLPTPVFWLGEFHGLYSPWVLRVGHDWATVSHLYICAFVCIHVYI